jgi:hypothetical protein
MKFNRYLTEQPKFYRHTQKTIDELASLLDKKCKPWFKEISKKNVSHGLKRLVITERLEILFTEVLKKV